MGLEPYALSIHHFISSVGADAGFASIIGLAILVLLYFAQARETSSLREQAELAAQRIAQLESRLSQVASAQAQPQAQPAVAVAAPPSSVIAAATARPAPTFAGVSPSPPAGVAAPPLSAATKLIPTPPVEPPAIAAPGVAAARIAAPGSRSPVVAAAATAMAGAPPGTLTPGSPPPVNRIVTPRPATPAGGAAATNGAGERPAPPLPPVPLIQPRASSSSSPPILGDYGGGRERQGRGSDLTRVLTVVAAVAVVAAIVIVLLSLTSSPASHTTSRSSGAVSNAPKVSHHRARPKPTAVNDASVTVAVLNGTAVYHLADGISTQLSAAGFKPGTVTNAATQTQATTTVEYAPGDQRDAAAVQKALKLSPSSVQPMSSDTQALGCPQASSCSVVVTVGQDLASSQPQTTTG